MLHLSRVLIKGSRPKTLIASISPVLIGSSFAYRHNYFNPTIFFFTLCCALLIQILTNLANDYFDFKKGADTHARIGPQRIMQSGLITESAMIKTLIAVTCATVISAITLIQIEPIIVTGLLVLALIFAYLYTATPYALAYTGMADIVVFICFGPLAFYMTQLLQTKYILYSSFYGVGAGALSASLLALNNLRDFEEDKKAEKKTLIVRFGLDFGKKQILFYTLLIYIPLFVLTKNHWFFTLPMLFSTWPLIKFMRYKTSHEFARCFPMLTLFFYCYTLSFCTLILCL